MLRNCNWSSDREYKTGTVDDPLKFYLNGLNNSTEFDLLLGYFSSAAINLLSLGFASFISKGGRMRLVINHFLSAKDKEAILNAEQIDKIFDLTDSSILKKSLSNYDTQFFECLSYLISVKRIEIKVIKPKDGNGIAHFKSGVFSDRADKVSFKGSCNFTFNGLSANLEELETNLSWENEFCRQKTEKKLRDFEAYFNELDNNVEYVSIKNVEEVLHERFGNKDLNELLVQEEKLLKTKLNLETNSNLRELLQLISDDLVASKNLPKFPYLEGPREYQTIAYDNWVANDYKGIFAMATGTGKTITALNCVLNEYKLTKRYNFIVLVPTTALVLQWENEIINNFNFENTIICSSSNKWEDKVKGLGRDIAFGMDINYVLIITYATFSAKKFQTIFNNYLYQDFAKITLIADEAHTMGSTGFRKVLPEKIDKRIGLSATPERQFDSSGNQILADFFSCNPKNYTFEYNMKEAIENNILSRYYYYPKVVTLEYYEQEEYLRISKQLVKYINPETGQYKDLDIVKNLLIKRKNVIHKAEKKINALVEIVTEIGSNNFNDAFIYVPEGIEVDRGNYDDDYFGEELDNRKIIDEYTNVLYEKFNLKLAKFTGETKGRDLIIQQFKDNKLDALLAMKCLDEGIDIPQAKFAIFCSSTGNPRQYIQRRGRVLRKSENKEFAYIYDLIVRPFIDRTSLNMDYARIERNMFLSEIRRVVNFAVLSENKDLCLMGLQDICFDLNIDLYKLANEEIDKY